MSDGFDVSAMALTALARQWDGLDELMASASTELGAAETGGFPPDVQGAAKEFLAAWSGYASESSTLARGFAAALRSSGQLYGRTDTLSQQQLDRLDGRLGPAR